MSHTAENKSGIRPILSTRKTATAYMDFGRVEINAGTTIYTNATLGIYLKHNDTCIKVYSIFWPNRVWNIYTDLFAPVQLDLLLINEKAPNAATFGAGVLSESTLK